MKAGVDGFSLSRSDSGIEAYTTELIKGLVQNKVSSEVYTLTEAPLPFSDAVTIKSSRLGKDLSTIAKLKWELFDITDLVSPDIDVFHCPHFILPLKKKNRYKQVVTLHDLAFLRRPEFFDFKTKLYYKLFLRQSLATADAIICISQSCHADLAFFYPSFAKKSFCVYNGFKNYSNIDANEQIFSELNINSPYLLMIGTLNPRKNIINGVRAFELVAKERDLELIVVGKISDKNAHLMQHGNRVKFTGYIDEHRLSALYRNAEALLFPSHYEGFGFPILEAMSVGTPVITSAVSSMPEISDYPRDILCDPDDVNSIVNVIRLVTQPQNRENIVTHGYNNARKYSWQRMVRETIEIYEGLL